MLPVLLRHEVRFAIVGGYGAMVHQVDGIPPTADIDICPLVEPENLLRLAAALNELEAEPYFAETGTKLDLAALLGDAERLSQVKAVMLVTRWGPLDLVIRPDGISGGYRTLERQIEFVRAVEPDGAVLDLEVPVASIHHIYRSKKEAGRPKDLRALPALARALAAKLRGDRE